MKNSTITIICEGGLANRLGSLLSGVHLSKLYSIPYKVWWPETSWCHCKYNTLFTSDDNIHIDPLNDVSDVSTLAITHYRDNLLNWVTPKRKVILSNDYVMIPKDLLNQYEHIIWGHNKFPQYIDNTSRIELIQELKIHPDILKQADKFIHEHQISKDNTIGIHIRKTDFGDIVKEKFVYEAIKSHPDLKFFICSDNAEAESLFKELPNTLIYDKSEYVTKKDINNINWGDNVFRSEQSVIEAFIDMLILSRTSLQFYVKNSSFAYFSTLFSHYNINN